MISTLEKEITFRYLETRKKDGFLNIISIFSFIGIGLGVAVLIIVMAAGFHTVVVVITQSRWGSTRFFDTVRFGSANRNSLNN